MAAAGITAGTSDVPGGVIARSTNVSPRGLFKDGAMELISRALPPVPVETLRQSALSMQSLLHQQGVTSLTEPGLGPASAGLLDGTGSTAALKMLGDLAIAGEPSLRMNVLLLFAGTGGQRRCSSGRTGLRDCHPLHRPRNRRTTPAHCRGQGLCGRNPSQRHGLDVRTLRGCVQARQPGGPRRE